MVFVLIFVAVVAVAAVVELSEFANVGEIRQALVDSTQLVLQGG